MLPHPRKQNLKVAIALTSVAQLVDVSLEKLKGRWFDSYSGRWFEGLVPSWGPYKHTSMFLSHINVSLPLLLPPFPSL